MTLDSNLEPCQNKNKKQRKQTNNGKGNYIDKYKSNTFVFLFVFPFFLYN